MKYLQILTSIPIYSYILKDNLYYFLIRDSFNSQPFAFANGCATISKDDHLHLQTAAQPF